MKIVVLDADTLGSDMDFSPLNAAGEVVTYGTTSPEEVAKRIADADVVVLNKVKLYEDNLQYARNLSLIAITATGYDNVDTGYCASHGIAVCNVAGYSTDSVVGLTISTALYLWCRLGAYRDHVASGAYTEGNCFNHLTPVFHELRGRTWGIIGLGNIGMKVAEVARTLGCRVLVYTRTPKEGYPCVSLEEVVRDADILSLHTPLTPQTKGMIDRDLILQMKEGCVLVNEARGAVVDESAVRDAVQSGHILYGADVYSAEPFPADNPIYAIRSHPNTCLTPHMAWGAYEARVRCLEAVRDNILAFQKGEKTNRIV